MSWVCVTLRVNKALKMKEAGKKVAKGQTFRDLAHQLTNNELVADETFKLEARIT